MSDESNLKYFTAPISQESTAIEEAKHRAELASVAQFFGLMCGQRTIGIAENEEITDYISPSLHTHLVALLGPNIPKNASYDSHRKRIVFSSNPHSDPMLLIDYLEKICAFARKNVHTKW